VTRILGIGCGLFLFGGFCIGGLAIPWMMAASSPATDAASGFLADVHESAWSNALARMSSEYQSSHSASQLEANVRGIDALADHDLAVLTNVETHDDGHVTVEGSLYGTSGESPVAFEVTETNGYWYVDLVAVGGRPLP
jgi:hypothetical protein